MPVPRPARAYIQACLQLCMPVASAVCVGPYGCLYSLSGLQLECLSDQCICVFGPVSLFTFLHLPTSSRVSVSLSVCLGLYECL